MRGSGLPSSAVRQLAATSLLGILLVAGCKDTDSTEGLVIDYQLCSDFVGQPTDDLLLVFEGGDICGSDDGESVKVAPASFECVDGSRLVWGHHIGWAEPAI